MLSHKKGPIFRTFHEKRGVSPGRGASEGRPTCRKGRSVLKAFFCLQANPFGGRGRVGIGSRKGKKKEKHPILKGGRTAVTHKEGRRSHCESQEGGELPYPSWGKLGADQKGGAGLLYMRPLGE